MSKKFVVVSGKNLQSLTGLQCFIQDSSTPGQVQEISNVQTFAVSDAGGGDGGVGTSGGATTSVQRVSAVPVSVCFASAQILNPVVITSAAPSDNVLSNPAQLESIVQGEEGDGEDPSDNLSGDEYSFQENEEEVKMHQFTF